MKRFWVDIRPWDKKKATKSIESGADALIVDEAPRVRELGRVTCIAPDGDLVPEKDVHWIDVRDKETEEEALRLARDAYVVVRTENWEVIPLENLVAQSDRILAVVRNAEEASLVLNVLEKGVCGVVLEPEDPGEIVRVADLITRSSEHVDLAPFTITAVRQVGMGDRVCVDTCSLMKAGQGMLVGDTSSAFLLVHAETIENPYVSPRPFRVNAGAVHAYILLPGGKTAYLSELETGDRSMVVDSGGDATEAVVGRVKVERRPLLVVEAEYEGVKATLVLQNAETIRLVNEDGSPRSVVDLRIGDRVLGHVAIAGRHFGIAVDETILEK